MPRGRPLPPTLTPAEWSLLSRRLTKYAHFRLGKTSWATAEEFAQEAIAQLLDPAYAGWDAERYPDVLDQLGSIVNGLVANHRKKKANRLAHVPLRGDDRTHDDELPGIDEQRAAFGLGEVHVATHADAVHVADARTAEDHLAPPSRERDALDAVLLRLHGDALATALFERIRAGETSAAANAKALGVSVAEVYTAKRRITHHARQVAKSVEARNEAAS